MQRVLPIAASALFAFLMPRGAPAQEVFLAEAACTYYSHEVKETLYLFSSDKTMNALVEEIVSAAGRPRNFLLFGANVSKVVAAYKGRQRYLLYDQFSFSTLGNGAPAERWKALAILAHQVGHHLSSHPLTANQTLRREAELEADRFSGFALRKMGASLEQAQSALAARPEQPHSPLYPGIEHRLEAVRKGWQEQQGNRNTFPFVSEDAFPQFPWPPPAPSASRVIPSRVLLGDAVGPRLIDVAERLQEAFDQAGYVERSFFAVPQGFAIVSRLEQISPDGLPKTGAARWSVKLEPPKVFSLGSYLRALLTSNPGHYRLVVFIVTSTPFHQGEASVDMDTARDWLRWGLNALPPAVGIQKLTSAHHCTALIYEFEQNTPDVPARFKAPSSLTAQQHLEQARLWQALAR